jgi:simple sugar transport system ATP-binding protein
MADELVRMERINKFFGHVQSLNDVRLTVRKNEIIDLLVENRHTQSTMI